MNAYTIFSFLLCVLSYTLDAHQTMTYHRYLWANYNHFAGNLTTSAQWYETLFSSNCSVYTYKGYLNFLSETKQYAQIMELIPSLEKKFEKDPEIQLIFALALEKNGQQQQAENRLLTMSSAFKTHPEIALRSTQIYIQRKELENALLTIDAFLNNSPRKPNNFVFYYLKSQVNVQLNKYQDALASITLCLDMHPHFNQGWLLLATLQEQKGEIEKAITGYGTFLELSGGNAAIEKHLISLVQRKKQTISYSAFAKSYFDQALSYFEKKEYETSLSCLITHLKQYPTDDKAQLLHIKVLGQLQHYDQLKTTSSHLIKQSPPQLQKIPQALYQLSFGTLSPEKTITLLQELAQEHPENYWLSLYAADLCLRNEKFEDALPLLKKALAHSTQQQLNAKINHQLALLAYEKRDYSTMLTYLEEGYAQDNNQAHINNSLAYYWAKKGNNIIKAQKFIAVALNQQKTNPYFIDTQATIFYKQQEYSKAQQLLEQLQNKHTSTTLLNLAKIHYKLDNKEKAVEYMKKATERMTNNHDKKSLNKLKLALNTHD